MSRTATGAGGRLSDDRPPSMEQREFLNHCLTPADSAATGPNVGNSNKVLSRNANGTIAMTSQPTNESELQLYRVLQRANLLSYYDTFIGQGGDDVQQLCEAGEEEFLEIMALVGMASKPLHVRRLQKALQEWVNNPAMFQTPLVPTMAGHSMGPMTSSRPMNLSQHNHLPATTRPSPPMSLMVNNHPPSPSLVAKETAPSPTAMQVQAPPPTPSALAQANGVGPDKDKPDACPPFYLYFKGSEHGCPNEYGQPGSPLQLTPVLVESQIQRLSEAAEVLIKSLPPFEPKPQNSKKKICKELEYVINMSDDDPRRMDEIRKYAAIYGRFDCKRKPEKPLTLHEVSVNEAAAQICRHIPALLTRRDELFPLARQVVRDSGYQYSKGHSRSHNYNPRNYGNCDDASGKRARLEQGSPDSNSNKHDALARMTRRQERVETLAEELKQLNMQQEELRARLTQARDAQDYNVAQQLQQQLEQLNAQQVQMMSEQSELVKRIRQSRYYGGKGNGRMSSCSDADRPDTDDTDDSQYSFSNTSSPSQDVHDSSSQDYPTPPVQVQDVFPMKGNGNSSNGASKKGTPTSAAHITKQMMQETLMDEGLRVVKELSSQIKEDPDSLVVPGMSLSMAMAMAAAAAAGDGLSSSSHHHHHHGHHSHHGHHHHHHHHGQQLQHHHHHRPSSATSPVLTVPHAAMAGYRFSGGNGAAANGSVRQNGQPDADSSAPPPSSDVEKAAASTINALLSLSQNAGRGLKQELPSPTCSKAE